MIACIFAGLAVSAARPSLAAGATPSPASTARTVNVDGKTYLLEDPGQPGGAFFSQQAQGWFWYHDPKLVPVKPRPHTHPSAPVASAAPPAPVKERPATPPAAMDPMAVIKAERHALNRALAVAMLDPTPDNVRHYMVLNAALMQQATNFAQAWRGVTYATPSLDYALTSPTGSAAYTAADRSAAESHRELLAAARHWGMVFFFRGTCPYCHRFAPLLARFAKQYGFHVIPVTLDGGSLPEYPAPEADRSAAHALKVTAVPALYLIDPARRAVIPAVFGLVGWTELKNRVLYALHHAEQQEAQPTGGPAAVLARFQGDSR
jgi:hypothetical protein